MKRHPLFILILLLSFSGLLKAQTLHQDENFTLNTEITGDHIYEARDFVKMEPGFHYQATGTESFRAKTNPYLVFPPEGGETGGPDPEDDGVVGSIVGAFDVSKTGAAKYNIPLDIPEGRKGMNPEISFAYSSQGGESVICKGWHINGISAISRTPYSHYYNGETHSIELQNKDQLLLDGQHIFKQPNGNYKTEQASFTKIEPISGDINNGFLVYKKNGKIYKYGVDDNSRLFLQSNQKPVTWYLNSIEDRQGNVITYEYYNDSTNGFITIQAIRYTGNLKLNENPFYEISFEYVNDTSGGKKYFPFGNETFSQKTKRLDQIDINFLPTNKTLKSYKLEYSTINNTQNKYLTDVTLEVNNGKHYNETNFFWESINPYNTGHNEDLQAGDTLFDSDNGEYYMLFTSDLNQDLKNDFIAFRKDLNSTFQELHFYINNIYDNNPYPSNNDFSHETFETDIPHYTNILDVKTADINGDRINDIIVYYLQAGYIQAKIFYLTYNHTSNSVVVNYTSELFNNQYSINNYPNPIFINADFNSDGLTDCYISYENGLVIEHEGIMLLSEYSNPFTNKIITDYDYKRPDQGVLLGDFDGDLKTEILMIDESATNLIHYKKDNGGWISITDPNILFENQKMLSGDFNADGRTDIIAIDQFSDTCRIYHSYKPEMYEFKLANTFSLPDYDASGKWITADINGDGHTDLRQINTNSSFDISVKDYIMNKKGTAFENTYQGLDIPNSFPVQWNNILSGDFNGNGKISNIIPVLDITNGLDVHIGSTRLIKVLQKGKEPRIDKIVDGLGKQISDIEYDLFANIEGYNVAENLNYPVANYMAPLNVVKSYKSDNSITKTPPNQYKFKYGGATEHVGGKGFLGFNRFETTNVSKNINTAFYYSSDENHYFIKNDSIITTNVDNKCLSRKIFSYDIVSLDSLRFFANASKKLTQSFNVNGELLSTTLNKFYINDFLYGTVDSTVTLTDKKNLSINSDEALFDFRSSQHYSYYPPDNINWVNGLVKNTRIIKKSPNDSKNYTRYKEYQYYGDTSSAFTLLRNIKKIYPENTSYNHTKSFIYDNYGNTIKITQSVPNASLSINDRIEYFEFGDEYYSRFVTKKWKTLGNRTYEESYDYYNDLGKIKTQTSINGLITGFEYDEFGIVRKKTLPNGNIQMNAKRWVLDGDENAPNEAIYYNWSQKSGEAPVKEYHDKFGRVVRKVITNFDGQLLFTDTEYDQYGNVKRASAPHFKGNNPIWTSFDYNIFNDKKAVYKPNDTISYIYNENTVRIESANTGLLQNKETNAIGQLVTSTDKGGSVNYSYYSSGLTSEIITGDDNIINVEYDVNGNKVLSNDPDLGEYRYSYNEFGDIVTTTYPNGDTDSLVYDDLGRVVQQFSPNYTKTIVYDEANNGLGKVSHTTKSNGIEMHYEYDELGRVKNQTEIIEGNSFESSYQYGNFGRVKTNTHPSGLKVNYSYNEFGYKEKTSLPDYDINLSTVLNMNEFGKVTQKESESGYVSSFSYDQFGYPQEYSTPGVFKESYTFDYQKEVLTDRYKHLQNDSLLHESFVYDDMRRLEGIYLNNTESNVIKYYSNGNIQFKKDAGLYGYEEQNSSPHAVTSLSNNPGTVSDSLSINYTSFNKISVLDKGANLMTLKYGLNNNRKVSSFFKDDILVKQKHYFAGGAILCNEEGKETYLHNIGDAIVKTDIDGKLLDVFHVYRDYLGSVVAVTNKEELIAENSFDAWGRQRNPDDWTYNNVPGELMFDMGYTGHEHLSQFSLINMNGRVYDPVSARFLSPDPYTQFPESTQNYNRYAYALNNPLKYTDPSGYNVTVFEKIMKPIVNVLTFPGRFMTAIVYGGINHPINGSKEDSEFGSFNWNYLLRGGATFSKQQWINFMAGEKNEIINGGPGLTFGQDNHALYNELEAMSIQNQMNEFMASRKFAITIAFESTKDPDQILSKVDYSSYSMMDDVLAAINDAGYGMRYTGKKGNSKKGDDHKNGEELEPLGGWSVDVTLVAGNFGFTADIGVIWDPNTGRIQEYITYGRAYGFEASAGVNLIGIKPRDGFKFSDIEGTGTTVSGGYIVSFALSGNSTPGYGGGSTFDTFTMIEVGYGPGAGGHVAPQTETHFFNLPTDWVPTRRW